MATTVEGPRTPPRSGRSRSRSPRQTSTSCARASPRRAGPAGSSSPIARRACSWRRSRRSPATGRPSYDWRACEARLNALPQFTTEIDGVDIHFIHVKSRARERAAADHDARLARLGHRAARDRRPAHRPDRARRQRRGRVPPGAAVPARLRLLRRADRARLGSRPRRARLGGADAPPRLHPLRRPGRRRGRRRHRRDGPPGARRAARHPHQPARRGAGRRRPAAGGHPSRNARRSTRSPRSTRAASATSSSRPRGRRRSATPCWTHPSPWRPGCSTTTRTATTRSPAPSSTGSPRAISPGTRSSTTSRCTG